MKNDFYYKELTDPNDWWKYSVAPLPEQIEVVNKITQVLEINFPVCSYQYTRGAYAWFIRTYAKKYQSQVKEWLETNDFISDVEFLS